MVHLRNSVEFAYWLQGAIEIGTLTDFSKAQKDLIINMLGSLAEESELTFVLRNLFKKSYGHPELFSVVNKELQAKFLHEIDPSYEEDQQFLLDVHQGKKGPKNDK